MLVALLVLPVVLGLVPGHRIALQGQLQRSTKVGYYSPDGSDGGVLFDDSELDKLVDRSSRESDTWWDLFHSNSEAQGTPAVKLLSPRDSQGLERGWRVDLNAWRSAVPGESIKLYDFVDRIVIPGGDPRNLMLEDMAESHPPPSIMSYLDGTAELEEPHKSQVDAILNDVLKKGSMKQLDAFTAARVTEAFRIAYIVLWGKTTLRSLEVSINRARGVAAVLGELKADIDVIISGILQDVFDQFKSDERAPAIRAALLERFGAVSVELCEKYNRLPKFMARKAEYSPEASENHIQMLVATAEDYRVLYIRLADRLHTLRVLRSLPVDEKDRNKIAQEALHVYAPLAHKMGVMKVKGELEDLAFKTLNPDAFRKTKYTQIAANKAYHEAAELIQGLINEEPFLKSQKARYRMTYRIKDKYQLYLKMQRKKLKSLSEVRDALGLRIIVDVPLLKDETAEANKNRGEGVCYYLVDQLRTLAGWSPAENGFKDYIQFKKENGYQSLHQYIRNTALGTNVEVQVRTRAMHQQAELGEAAHWHYKDMLYRPEVADSKLYRVAWRSPEQAYATSAAELLGMAKKQLLANRVFVFLDDRATVLNLKRGSTALDAAFAIHTDIGMATRSVTVDGVRSRLDHTLVNGETVSVQRADVSVDAPQGAGSGPSPHWLTMVHSAHAKATLRQHFARQARSHLAVLGCVQLMMALSLSSGAVRTHSGLREGANLPDVAQLEEWARQRVDGKDLVDVLVHIGDCSKLQAQSTLCRLLNVPEGEMTASSIRWSLTWARVEGKHGWGDRELRAAVLLPLLHRILPARGVVDAERRWLDLVGRHSLSDERSHYHTKLSRHLKSAARTSGAGSAASSSSISSSISSSNGMSSSSLSSPGPSAPAATKHRAKSNAADMSLKPAASPAASLAPASPASPSSCSSPAQPQARSMAKAAQDLTGPITPGVASDFAVYSEQNIAGPFSTGVAFDFAVYADGNDDVDNAAGSKASSGGQMEQFAADAIVQDEEAEEEAAGLESQNGPRLPVAPNAMQTEKQNFAFRPMPASQRLLHADSRAVVSPPRLATSKPLPSQSSAAGPYSLEATQLPRSLLTTERRKYARKVSMRESFGSRADNECPSERERAELEHRA